MTKKTTKTCLAAAMVLAFGCAVKNMGGDGLELAKDSKPTATIVIAKEADRAARFAAAELQWHIEKMTGAKLPVATDEDKVAGNRILVGESRPTRELGLCGNDFKNQEYLIRFLPDTLILMGKDKADERPMNYADFSTFPGQFDEQGTCYAVYDFLERFCGVRWYLPTEVGLVCPQEKTLVVKGADVRREPAMKYRLNWCLPLMTASLIDEPGPRLPPRDGVLFGLRQRMGGRPYACNHAFYGYYKRHLKDHPEWFAQGYDKDMPEGMRNKPMGPSFDNNSYPMLYYPNMCYTNEGFIRQVVNRANDYFETGRKEGGEAAEGDYFSLGPMDSSGNDKMCQCAECKKYLHKDPPCEKWRKNPFFWDDKNSDYIFGFVNKVAREVGKKHPDKYLTMFAYHQTYYPPTMEPLEPNVAMTFCIHALLRAVPAMDRAVNDLMNKWEEESKTRQKYLWLYFHRPGPANPFFPGFMPHKMVEQMKDYHKRGFLGVFVEPPYFPEAECKGAGFARWAPVVNQLELYLTFKLADDPTLDGDKLIDEFFSLYYGAAGDAMKALCQKIESVYCDPSNYSFNTTNYYGYQTKDIAWGKLGTKERMAELEKLMGAAKNAAKTEMEKKRVDIFERSVWKRMKAGREEYEKQETQKKGGKIGSALAPLIAGAAPNGDLDKVDWTQAGTLKKWGALDGKATGRQLEGRVLHDGKFLYVRLQETTDASKLVCAEDIWSGDDWELFFGLNRGGAYRQMGVNPKGESKALAYGEKNTEWDSGAKVASDTSKGWSVRIALPLEKLLPGGVRPGQTIHMNICRGASGDIKNSASWNPTFAGFHAPSQMGGIRLSDKAGVSMTERTEGE